MTYTLSSFNDSTVIVFHDLPSDVRELLNQIMDATVSEGIKTIALPADKLAPDFFVLSSGYAGEILQKLTNYSISTLITGDIRHYQANSNAFRDFVFEANKGRSVNFIDSLSSPRA